MQIKFLEAEDKDFLIEEIKYYQNEGYEMQGGIGVYNKQRNIHSFKLPVCYVTLVKYEEDTTKKNWKDWFKKLRG